MQGKEHGKLGWKLLQQLVEIVLPLGQNVSTNPALLPPVEEVKQLAGGVQHYMAQGAY